MFFVKKIFQHLTKPGVYSLIQAGGWTIIVAVSLLVTLFSERQEMMSVARNVANAYIDKDILFREWVALHGGIYVPVSATNPPNPLLRPPMVSERDITTPSGRRLTLVNPAYLTLLLYDLAQSKRQISCHITSLNPLNPQNIPDEWETRALRTFEKGTKDFSAVLTEKGGRYLRLMRPLITEENCLLCHHQQGYKVGDIRGGISVKMPMALFEESVRKQSRLLWAGHGILWFLGLAGLSVGYQGLKFRTAERDRAEEELRRVNRVLASQASTDFLTGIYNRRKFRELLDEDVRAARRYDMPLALIFFDIDHFKAINDTFGHDTGDRVLQEIALLIGGLIRQTDVFARYGGEEFAILAHNNDVRTGGELAEKIRKKVEGHVFPEIRTMTCSFGVVQFSHNETVEQLICRADRAMYTAKEKGRNRVEKA